MLRSFVDAGHLCITVTDNGIGIDLEKYEHKLFRMFSRLTEKKDGSNGVGLYIVKRTMDQAGGRVSVQSQPGEGTTFQLSFPPNCIP